MLFFQTSTVIQFLVYGGFVSSAVVHNNVDLCYEYIAKDMKYFFGGPQKLEFKCIYSKSIQNVFKLTEFGVFKMHMDFE